MKKQSIVKNMLLGGILTIAVAATTQANDATNFDPSKGKVEVKYAGYFNNDLSFNVKFNNPTGETFTLVVLDENGESLFKSTYSDKKFNKKFVLPKGENNKLTFVIQSGKENYTEKFNVQISTREVEDVIVKKG